MKLKKYGKKVGMDETQYNYPTSIAFNLRQALPERNGIRDERATRLQYSIIDLDNYKNLL